MKSMGKYKLTAAALVAGAMLSTAAIAQPAVSPAVAQGLTQANTDNVQLVRDGRRGWGRHGHWRGHRHHRHGWGRGWGWGLAGAAAAGLLLGAPYAYGAYDDGYYGSYYDGPSYAEAGYARCAQTFRSFDPGSGTYMGYDGVRRRCPYI